MTIICVLFILFPLIVTLLVFGPVALRSLYSNMTLDEGLARTRRWIAAAITSTAILAVGHYAFNGPSNVTDFLVKVVGSLIVAWCVFWLMK